MKRLANETYILFDQDQIAYLNEITTFNLEARYDDYKLIFYKKANKDFAKKWMKICEDLYKLIITNI